MPLPQIELRLVPAPGAKPEFLALLEPESKPGEETKAPPLWNQVVARPDQQSPRTITIESYTREDWANSSSSKAWITYHVESVDGRQKLPGFIKYLRERKKTAYGRFHSAKTSSSTFVWVVSDKQSSNTILSCRVAPLSSIANCPLKPLQPDAPKPPPSQSQPMLKQPPPTANMQPPTQLSVPKPTTFQSKRKGLGLLGNLVKSSTTMAGGSGRPTATTSSYAASSSSSSATSMLLASDLKTSGEIIADFRAEMERKMIDFQANEDLTMKLPLKVSDVTEKARTQTDAARVTMDVLRYIVAEAVEEADEEWVCHKEPSEFMDECVLCIYKREEDVPPEVLEELNRVELPEDAKVEQHKIQEARRQQELKAQQIRERLQQEKLRNAAKRSGGGGGGNGEDNLDGGLATLNTNKRDRRTVEDYEREAKIARQE